MGPNANQIYLTGVMAADDRDNAIAVAEACVRAAGVGEPKLLTACHRSGREPLHDGTVKRLREVGATEADVEYMQAIRLKLPPRPRWEIQFLLFDPRYVDGITIAFVTIEDATGKPEFKVFQRGERPIP
jgi:hypothetical protein